MDRTLSFSNVIAQIDQLPFLEDFKQLLLSKSANLDSHRLQEAVRNLELAEKEIFDLFQEPDLFGRVTDQVGSNELENVLPFAVAADLGSSTPQTAKAQTEGVPRSFRVRKSLAREAISASSGSGLPKYTMRELLEAGVQFGHQKQRWNPKMSQYIYGERNGIHILDLTQTTPLMNSALEAVRTCARKGGSILFVGTKKQARKWTREAAVHCSQFYINHRWLGGTLTNWPTIERSILRLRKLELEIDRTSVELTDTARSKKYHKLEAALGGIQKMTGPPDMVFIVDVNKEKLAVAEAQKMNIPVVALVDTNSDPTGVDYIIPGNDDATASIKLICELISRAVIAGSTHAEADTDNGASNADFEWGLDDELEAAFEHNAKVEFE